MATKQLISVATYTPLLLAGANSESLVDRSHVRPRCYKSCCCPRSPAVSEQVSSSFELCLDFWDAQLVAVIQPSFRH